MTVHRWRGLRRMLLDGDHGFADGYLDGDWSTPELGQLLEFCMQNESALTATAAVGRLGLMRNRLVHWLRHNTRRGSRRNIAAHYDLGNDFFRPWLDAGMNYSSALYANCDTLERAQEAKLDRAAALLDLDGGERVLEIGCGWGAFAERLIRHYGCQRLRHHAVDRTARLSRKRGSADEVERGRADLRLLDYRDVPGTFDRIASIEMIEAVGERYWPNYFGKIRDCLANGGVALLQAITIDEHRFAAYRKCPDFIQRYIFPGGVLPTVSIIEREAARAGLKLVHHEVVRRQLCAHLARMAQPLPARLAEDRTARLQRRVSAACGNITSPTAKSASAPARSMSGFSSWRAETTPPRVCRPIAAAG